MTCSADLSKLAFLHSIRSQRCLDLRPSKMLQARWLSRERHQVISGSRVGRHAVVHQQRVANLGATRFLLSVASFLTLLQITIFLADLHVMSSQNVCPFRVGHRFHASPLDRCQGTSSSAETAEARSSTTWTRLGNKRVILTHSELRSGRFLREVASVSAFFFTGRVGFEPLYAVADCLRVSHANLVIRPFLWTFECTWWPLTSAKPMTLVCVLMDRDGYLHPA